MIYAALHSFCPRLEPPQASATEALKFKRDGRGLDPRTRVGAALLAVGVCSRELAEAEPQCWPTKENSEGLSFLFQLASGSEVLGFLMVLYIDHQTTYPVRLKPKIGSFVPYIYLNWTRFL